MALTINHVWISFEPLSRCFMKIVREEPQPFYKMVKVQISNKVKID
jgi:hypothetical protein